MQVWYPDEVLPFLFLGGESRLRKEVCLLIIIIIMAERGLPRAAPNPDTLAPLFPSHPFPSHPIPFLPFPSLPFPVLFPVVCAGAVIFVSSSIPPNGAPLRGAPEIF